MRTRQDKQHMTCEDKTREDKSRHVFTWHEKTWENTPLHDTRRQDMRTRQHMTREDKTWGHVMKHNFTWHKKIRHKDMSKHNNTQHKITNEDMSRQQHATLDKKWGHDNTWHEKTWQDMRRRQDTRWQNLLSLCKICLEHELCVLVSTAFAVIISVNGFCVDPLKRTCPPGICRDLLAGRQRGCQSTCWWRRAPAGWGSSPQRPRPYAGWSRVLSAWRGWSYPHVALWQQWGSVGPQPGQPPDGPRRHTHSHTLVHWSISLHLFIYIYTYTCIYTHTKLFYK